MAYSRRRYSRRYSSRYSRGYNSAFPTQVIVVGAIIILLFWVPMALWSVSFKVVAGVFVTLIVSFLVSVTAIALHKRYRIHRKAQSLSLSQVDHMRGIDFEYYLAELLKFRGYKQVKVTKASGDQGADLTAVAPDGVSTAFQAKQYNTWKRVGVEAVYQVNTGRMVYGCERAMVITTGNLTRQARKMAADVGVEVVERDELIDWIDQFQHRETSFGSGSGNWLRW